jgi:hypothetical protein
MVRLTSIALILVAAVSTADAQLMIKREFPFQTNRDSFFEYTGVNWNLRGPNFRATFGQPFQGAPAFGNFNPNAGIRTGFGFGGGRFSGGFNFNFAQGYSRTSTSITPVINSLNGYPATLSFGIYRPYVLGFQPVFSTGFGSGGFGGFGNGGFGAYGNGFGGHGNGFCGYGNGFGGYGNGFGGGFNNGGFYSVPQYGIPQQVPYRVVPHETPLTGVMRRLQERGSVASAPRPKREPVRVDENRESVALRYFNTSGGTLGASNIAPQPTPAEEADDAESVAMKLFEKGQDAEKKSKTGTARMYYRIASEKATGKLKQRIVLKLNQLR